MGGSNAGFVKRYRRSSALWKHSPVKVGTAATLGNRSPEDTRILASSDGGIKTGLNEEVVVQMKIHSVSHWTMVIALLVGCAEVWIRTT